MNNCNGHHSLPDEENCFWRDNGSDSFCESSANINDCEDINSNTPQQTSPEEINSCDDAKDYFGIAGLYEEGCRWLGVECVNAPPFDCGGAHQGTTSQIVGECKAHTDHYCFWNGRDECFFLFFVYIRNILTDLIKLQLVVNVIINFLYKDVMI
jgi:hypothetical protein